MTDTTGGRDEWIYVVTDIEVDGPWPGPNSMRSFASVAVTANGEECGIFEAVLEPLPGAAPNPDTYAWFQTQPEAWAAATTDPQPVQLVMNQFAAWVRDLPGPRMFAASPIAFDGSWMDYYLRRFTRYGLVQGPYEEDVLFNGPGLCLRSYAAAVTGRPVADVSPQNLPSAWFGDIAHTHRAIDDARGYAHLLGVLFRRARTTDAYPGC
ncbi:exonuclease [Dactylosporangium sp. NPDC000244]|uniref:exonuclease n=1 Tax=Dactylosporangium sp. NPDC000244 TaxID=3154365 RepID=UPI003320C8BA